MGKRNWSGYGKKLSNRDELTCYSASGNGAMLGGCDTIVGARGAVRGTGWDTERK